MKIQTAVPVIVYNQLKNGQSVNAITDFEHGFSKIAYQLLSARAHMKNFFFGLVIDTTNKDDLDYLSTASNEQNSVILQLDIPKEELFIHDYYDFSSLIYDAEGYDGVKVPLATLNDYADHLADVTPNRVQQAIYTHLDPSWIISATEVKKNIVPNKNSQYNEILDAPVSHYIETNN